MTQNHEVKIAATYGELAVGLAFNPSANPAVEQCKKGFAAAIDQLHELRLEHNSAEIWRLANIAITEVQTAQMWAIKALTWKD